VRALLADLQAAAEAREADRVAARMAAGFRGADGITRDEALVELKRYFAAYESVSVQVHGIEIERGDGAARVSCMVELSGRARRILGLEGLLPPSAVYRFRLGVEDEAGTWRVRDADWERADTAPPEATP
jgi:hypothetical protein